MRCDKVKELLSFYIDNELDNETSKEIKKHIEVCEECKREYEDLVFIQKLLSETPQVELPQGFKAELHNKLIKCQEAEQTQLIDMKEANKKLSNKKKRINWKVLSGLAAGILIMVVSASSILNNNFLMDKSAKTEQAAPKEAMPFSVSQNEKDEAKSIEKVENGEPQKYSMTENNNKDMNITAKNRSIAPMKEEISEDIENIEDQKIIINGYIHLEVEEYEAIYENVVNIATNNGGFIQSSSTSSTASIKNDSNDSLKEGNIVVRIPKTKFDSAFNEIMNMGNIIDKNKSFDNITIKYGKAVSKIEELTLEENRLKDEINRIENNEKIAEAKSELNKVLKSKNKLLKDITRLDDLTTLATIKVYLDEVD